MIEKPKKSLDQVRAILRLKNHSNPIDDLLTHMAVEDNMAPSTQDHAPHAPIYLYPDLLEKPIAGNPDRFLSARFPPIQIDSQQKRYIECIPAHDVSSATSYATRRIVARDSM